jgi:hypothetical protein
MERPAPAREKLLIEILELVRIGTLRGHSFGAAEVRTSGSVMLMLFNHEGGGSQPKLLGYIEADLEALGRAGLLEVTRTRGGKSFDVVVPPAAHDYVARLAEPKVKTVARSGIAAMIGLRGAVGFVLGVVTTLVLSAALGPWLRSIFGE